MQRKPRISCARAGQFSRVSEKTTLIAGSSPPRFAAGIQIQLLTTPGFGHDVAPGIARPCLACCSEGYRSTAPRKAARRKRAARAFLRAGVQEPCAP